MTYQVLASKNRHSAGDEVGRADTLQEARGQARSWLSANGKPGEATARIWDEAAANKCLTMHMDADGLIHEDAGADMDRVQVVWDHLRAIANRVTPGRYDFDHKEYRFAVEGGYTVAVTREYLRETADLPGTLKSSVTLELIRNTGTEHTLVLTSEGIEARWNKA